MIDFIECKDSIEWNKFVEGEIFKQYVTIAHNPSLGAILSKTFGYKNENLFILWNSKVIGVMPIQFIGNKIVSVPHFSYGGPLINAEMDVKIDFNKFFKKRKYEIRSFLILSPFYNDCKVTFFLKLKNSEEDQWSSFRSKLRNVINKAKRFNLIFRQGGIEFLDDFYSVYSRNMLKLGSPPICKLFFQNLITDYKYGSAEISMVYYNGKAVASGFTLSYFNSIEVCWASADYKFNKYNVNSFLYWGMIKSSIENKYTYFSFGRSTKDSSTHQFKKSWGCIEVPIYFNYSERRKISMKKFHMLSKIWKLQPIITSNYFGGLISKYLY